MDIKRSDVSRLILEIIEKEEKETKIDRSKEFTVKDYMAEATKAGKEMPYCRAKRQLNKMIANGTLSVREVCAPIRGSMNAYCRRDANN